jgi:UDP-glucose 4-epimerase
LKPIFEPARVGDVRDSLADISLARKILKYEPIVGIEEGLRRTIEYYRAGA